MTWFREPFKRAAKAIRESANQGSSASPDFQLKDSSFPISASRDRQRRYSLRRLRSKLVSNHAA